MCPCQGEPFGVSLPVIENDRLKMSKMNSFSELLARKTQLRLSLAEGSSTKGSRAVVQAELKKVTREIEKWIQRNPAF